MTMMLRLPPVRLPPDHLAPMAEAKALRLQAARMEDAAGGTRLAAAARLRIKASEIEQAVFVAMRAARHAASSDEAARS
jgi:hypothetical protein